MKKRVYKLGVGLIWLLLILVIFRVCFFDVFTVPSDSMKSALKTGDLIFANKTLYNGALAPLLLRCGVKPDLKTNDILVFKKIKTDSSFYVKRCIGLPGQTIGIARGRVFINGAMINGLPTVRNAYKIWYSDITLCKQSMLRCNIDLLKSEFRRFPKFALVYVNDAEKDALTGRRGIDSLVLTEDEALTPKLAAEKKKYGGFQKDSSAFRVPFAGMKIVLNQESLILYRDILEKGEGVQVQDKKDIIAINGIRQNYYVFTKDYYFMMGDNRENSIDSRYFGPIPSDCIIGNMFLII